jgi:hypothetical protein
VTILGREGINSLTVDGTMEADDFEINGDGLFLDGDAILSDDPSATSNTIADISLFSVRGLDGDDVFQVNSQKFDIDGGPGNDKFFVHDTTDDDEGREMSIEGGSGENILDIQRIVETPRFLTVDGDKINNAAKGSIRYGVSDGGALEEPTVESRFVVSMMSMTHF